MSFVILVVATPVPLVVVAPNLVVDVVVALPPGKAPAPSRIDVCFTQRKPVSLYQRKCLH